MARLTSDGPAAMEITQWMISVYPDDIRAWINARGGLEKDALRGILEACRERPVEDGLPQMWRLALIPRPDSGRHLAKKMKTLAPTIMALALLPTLALAEPLQLPKPPQTVMCQASAKFSCAAETGCGEARLGVWNVIDMQGQTYARCDSRGCDKYDARMSRSGAFIIIDVPGRGMTAKLAADMSAFLEVVTIGTQALVSFGTCQMR